MRIGPLTAYGMAVMLACKPVARGVDRAQTRITEATQELSAEPESVMSRAVYQHFRARREAVAIMSADLRKRAVAAPALIADSGRPVQNLAPPHYAITASKGNDQ